MIAANSSSTAPAKVSRAGRIHLVVSYNPGYQRSMSELKPSTRQRFVGLNFGFPDADTEIEIVCHESGVDRKTASALVGIAAKTRGLTELALMESVSTRLLVDAGKLIAGGLPPRLAGHAAIAEPISDDADALVRDQTGDRPPPLSHRAMFEWEESTFLGLKSLYQRLLTKPRERRAAEVRAELRDRRQELFILGQMIAGKSVTIFETDEPALCDADRIFLPPKISSEPAGRPTQPPTNSKPSSPASRSAMGGAVISNRISIGSMATYQA